MVSSISSNPLCRLDELPEGEPVARDAQLSDGEENLILLRHGEQVRAYMNICPHAGRPLDWAPGKFLLSKGMLVCAAHGACFGVDDGVCISGPCKGESLRSVALTVVGGEVYVAA